MEIDLTKSVERLLQASNQLDFLADELPGALQSCLLLMRAQKEMIEVLVSKKKSVSPHGPLHKIMREQSYMLLDTEIKSSQQYLSQTNADKQDTPSRTFKRKVRQRVDPTGSMLKRDLEALALSLGVSTDTEKVIRGELKLCEVSHDDPQLESELTSPGIYLLTSNHLIAPSHKESKDTDDRVDRPIPRVKPRLSITVGDQSTLDVSPLTPERTWFRDPTPRASRYGLIPPIPDEQFPPELMARNIIGKYLKPGIASCDLCEDSSFINVGCHSSDVTDSVCKARVQKAISNLISAAKCGKRVPVGIISDSYALCSKEYEKYFCDQEQHGNQRLSVFCCSDQWENVMPELSPLNEGEVAMELMIRPRCQLIIKPFTPAKYAGWDWRLFDATSVADQTPQQVEIMFLGAGLLKVKIRLSQLLGQLTPASEPDRFIEFSGTWQNTRSCLKCLEETRELQSPNGIDLPDKAGSKVCPQETSYAGNRPLSTTMTNYSDATRRATQIWSPVSPLEGEPILSSQMQT